MLFYCRVVLAFGFLICYSSANATSEIICFSGDDRDYLQAKVKLYSGELAFSTTLFIDGKKADFDDGDDSPVVLERKGKSVFYSKSEGSNFTTFYKGYMSDDKSYFVLEEAKVGGDILISALSTRFECQAM